MGTTIIQVRDVSSDDVRILRARAAARNMSLSSYLRALIHDDATRPTMAEALGQIGSRDAVDVDGDVIRSFIDDGRR